MLMADIYIKVIGSLCVISGCAGVGLSVATSFKRRYQQLSALRRGMLLVRSEIRYACSELPEVFSNVAKRIESPFHELFNELSDAMRAMDGRDFGTIWNDYIEKRLSVSALDAEDRKLLKNLGGQLGYLDRETQLAAIDLYIKNLDEAILISGRILEQKRRLSLSLGLLSGFFLTILLL